MKICSFHYTSKSFCSVSLRYEQMSRCFESLIHNLSVTMAFPLLRLECGFRFHYKYYLPWWVKSLFLFYKDVYVTPCINMLKCIDYCQHNSLLLYNALNDIFHIMICSIFAIIFGNISWPYTLGNINSSHSLSNVRLIMEELKDLFYN